jgi:hypothetical protein
MLSKIILSVTSRQATVGLWRMGRLVSCTTYANNESGLDEFRQFLLQHPNIPIHLIADAVEEDFRLESMPHSSGAARNEMVERKLNQLYRNTSYRTAQFIGREADKRRDDQFLFIALTNPDIVTPWVTITEEQQAPLTGVYLLPMISQLLIKALKRKDADLLLMTRQSTGLRQTYFSGQHLRVSRLTPLTGMDERQIDKLYVSETQKTLLYLFSLRMIKRDHRLQLIFPTADHVDAGLARQLENNDGVNCTIIRAEELAKRMGLSAELMQRHPDLLHMHVLSRQRPLGNLAPGRQIRHYQLHQLRNGINVASAACAAGVAVAAAINISSVVDLGHQMQEAALQTRQQERLYEEVSSNFPKTPIPGNDLKVAVNLAEKIGELHRTPQRLMQTVSVAMDAQPEVQLNRLHWKFTEDANAKDDENKGPKSSAIAMPVPASPNGLYEIGFIDGEISNFSGDYRAALDSVNALAERLKQNPSVEQVVILQQPVNTSSLANLQGSTLDQQARQFPAALFKLKIILKPEVIN